MYHLYFVWIVNTPLTTNQKNRVAAVLRAFAGWRNNDDSPANNIQVRERLDRQAWLVEFSANNKPNKADIVNAIADQLGILPALLTSNSTFIALTFNGSRTDSEAAARQYLIDNAAVWEEEID